MSVARPTNAYVCHLIKSLLFQLIKSFFVSYFNTWFDLLVLTPVIWSKVLSSDRSNLSFLIKWFNLPTHNFVIWSKVLFQLIESFFLSYFNTWFDLLVLTPVIWSKVLSSGRSNLSFLITWFYLLTHAFVTWLKLSFFLILRHDLIYWFLLLSFDWKSSFSVD